MEQPASRSTALTKTRDIFFEKSFMGGVEATEFDLIEQSLWVGKLFNPRVTTSDRPVCFLFDNGSLRASSTRSLRDVATRLETCIGVEVRAVSLLHSSAVPADELDGRPAQLLEPALDSFFQEGGRTAVAVPLFFGASAALTEYLPGRLAALRAKHAGIRLELARELVRLDRREDTRIAQLLADEVRKVLQVRRLEQPSVLLVDHGSPQRKVTEVRERLGEGLRSLLGPEVGTVGTASMERRDGEEFAFNEPLLEAALRHAPFNTGHVVLALQFLSPGRHAGPEGDLVRICERAQIEQPGLQVHFTQPLTGHPGLVPVLTERYLDAIKPGS